MYFNIIQDHGTINSTKENKENKKRQVKASCWNKRDNTSIEERRRTHMIKAISEFLSAYYGEFAHREAKWKEYGKN